MFEAKSSKWSKEKIQEGFEKFFAENGRYPTSEEIDIFTGLPSSRQIQRAFGGLVNLRKLLGLKITNFGNGENRSKIAKAIGQRGHSLERDLEKNLIARFNEYFVHIEKPLIKYYKLDSQNKLKTKSRADFFVYAQNYNFCVDVFYAKNYRNLVSIINAKQKKYSDLTIDVYLINGNAKQDSDITKESIAKLYINKTNKLQSNVYILNLDDFINRTKEIQPIKAFYA